LLLSCLFHRSFRFFGGKDKTTRQILEQKSSGNEYKKMDKIEPIPLGFDEWKKLIVNRNPQMLQQWISQGKNVLVKNATEETVLHIAGLLTKN
jgi:hypothetical protein